MCHALLGILNNMNADIKAIIFDWGGVCCREGEPFASSALQESLQLTPDEITEKVRSIHKDYYIGKHSRDSFWTAIINFFGLTEDAEINPVALSNAYLNSYEVYPDVLDLILQLQSKYKIGLLSDLTPEMRGQIRAKHDLGKIFHVEVYSCDKDVQAKKPDIEMYQTILEKMGFLPEECLFIDNVQYNIQAADKIGMKVLLFKDRLQFFEDIKKIVEL